MMTQCKDLIQDLKDSNEIFIKDFKNELLKHIKAQNPKICVVTCSDSRVIPEFIFNREIGEIFVVRIAGNVIIDESVITSLEYAVDHLKIELLIILGHSDCGAVKATIKSNDDSNVILNEIKKGLEFDENLIIGNIKYQINQLPLRSKAIAKSIDEEKLCLKGAFYNLEDGKVEFL